MVNRGASRGCVTCRQRRVKCDETKPWCRECLRLGLECAGYARPRLRFKDETDRYLGKRSQVTRVSNRHHQSTNAIPSVNTILPFPSQSTQNLAVQFFLTYVTDVGRSLESTRGFLEFVRPVLAAENPSSALFAAVNAVAVKVWTTIGHNHFSESLSIRLFSQALMRLHQAINDPEERARDATVLAALVLQMYETLLAVSGQAKAHGTHRNGALALLLERNDSFNGSKYHAHLVGNLLHSRVSLSVRTSNALSSIELKWLKTQVIPVLPITPSSLLDIIGVSIASLQRDLCDPSLPPFAPSSKLQELRERVQRLDNQFQSWLEAIPSLWYPSRMQSGKDIDPSIKTYHGASDIYPSIQIANIWNTWRIYLLILEEAKLQLEGYPASSWSMDSSTETDLSTRNENQNRTGHRVQELVDSICYSIPFYLGNCTRSGILSNMENPNIRFPSYHDLHPSHEAFIGYKASDQFVSSLDHSRHVNLHGPLHTITILSHLTSLFARRGGSRIHLREEQKYWITEQFTRSLRLMNMMPNCSSRTIKPLDHKNDGQEEIGTTSWAEALADKFKKELGTITIL